MLTSQHPWEYDFDNYKNQKTHEEIAIMINSSRRLNPKKPSLCNETVSKELDEIILKSNSSLLSHNTFAVFLIPTVLLWISQLVTSKSESDESSL